MVTYHHRLNRQEFEQTPGDHGGQKSLMCCSPWGPQGSPRVRQDLTTEQEQQDPLHSSLNNLGDQ